MDHGIEMIASMLAVLKRGAAYVPAEPSFHIDRIRFMLTEAAVDAVLPQRASDDLFLHNLPVQNRPKIGPYYNLPKPWWYHSGKDNMPPC